MNLHTFDNVNDYVLESAKAIESFILNCLESQKVVRIALSGGSSPLPVYQALVNTKIPWSRVALFLVDERYVPANSNDSNAKMIQDILVDKVSNLRKFYDYNTLKPINIIVDQYQKTLEEQGDPLFDLVLLGLGSDGHTASLFPQIDALHEKKRLVVHTQSPDINTRDRLSLTFPAILNSQKVIFLIQGKNKQVVLADWLAKNKSIDEIPAIAVLDHKDLDIFYNKS